MKILVISNLYPPEIIGGYEVQCSEAVDALRSRGHDVRVLTAVPRRPMPSEDQSHVLRLLRTPDVYSHSRMGLRSPFWELESNLLNVENIYVLLQLLQSWEPDVIYLWNLVAIGGVGIVAVLEQLGLPWVWHLGDSVPAALCNFRGELRVLGAQMAKEISGRFIACSQTVLDDVNRMVPIGGRSRVVPNWVRSAGPSVERSYYDRSDLKMVYAGRIAEEKGVFILPAVVARLVERGHTGLSLDICGAGREDDLVHLVAELGVQDYVRLHGWVPKKELRKRLRNSDLLLFPTSPDDAMPLAPLEAASEGCVPIIPGVSGVSEWLVDGVNCLKAEATIDGYVEQICRVLEGEVDLADISRRAVLSVHSDFDLESIFPVVERELVVAAEAGRMTRGPTTDVYRVALLADAILRRHALVGGEGDIDSTGTGG